MKRVSVPEFPAVSASQLREWLRLDPAVDQSTLDLLLGAAVDHIEALTGQVVVQSDWQAIVLGSGCHAININHPSAVTLTAAGHPVDPTEASAAIVGDTVQVTVLADDLGPVTVRITAGWEDEETVPAALRHAVAVYVGAAFDSRHEIDDATFRTIEKLCRPWWRPSL